MAETREVKTLWLCEAHNVILRPDTLYRFEVDPECESCQEYAEAYEDSVVSLTPPHREEP